MIIHNMHKYALRLGLELTGRGDQKEDISQFAKRHGCNHTQQHAPAVSLRDGGVDTDTR